MKTKDLVRIAQADGVGIVTLDRPEARNALNAQLRAELASAFLALGTDAAVRAILIQGEGRSFCAGADIEELARRTVLDTAWYPDRLDKIVEASRKPVVGALHGHVLGGGLELSLCFTIRIAADDLKCGFPELKLGVFPGLGGTQRLSRLIGEARAMDLILTSRIINAEDALGLGLVTRVVPEADLGREALDLARSLAAGPPVAMACALESVRRAQDMPREEGLEFERRLFAIVCGTNDKAEGIAAWKDKRPAKFTGT